MLEEDALRFDAFLKENDEKVQEAIKHADTEAKAKQDKVGVKGPAHMLQHITGAMSTPFSWASACFPFICMPWQVAADSAIRHG